MKCFAYLLGLATLLALTGCEIREEHHDHGGAYEGYYRDHGHYDDHDHWDHY